MANKLHSYLQRSGISQRKFAELVGVDDSVISRFARDLAKPGLDVAVRIERISFGEVPASSWVPEDAIAPNPNEDAA